MCYFYENVYFVILFINTMNKNSTQYTVKLILNTDVDRVEETLRLISIKKQTDISAVSSRSHLHWPIDI